MTICLVSTVSEAQTGGFTVTSESASPTTVKPGGVLQLATTVKSSQAGVKYTVGLQVYYNDQMVAGQAFQNLVSTAGGSVTKNYNWTVPTTAPAGTYKILAAVWDPNWVWYTGAATNVTVASASLATPVNSALPVITGTAQVGKVLTSSTGTWAGATSFSYQWAGNGTPVTGATASTYSPAANDVGHTLSVVVTAKGPGGTASAKSAPTASVASAATVAAPGANLPAASQAAPYYTCVTNWYVDAVKGSDSNAGTSASAAFKTIGRATSQNAKLTAGGCVNVAPGTYNEFVFLSNAANQGGNLNGLTGFVVLRSTTPLAAKIVGPSTNGYSVVTLPSSYVVVDGFDVSGGAGSGHCIDGGFNWQTNHAHHLIVINNHVHNCGGGGIEFSGGDYYIIEHNTSNNNAATNGYQTSGISIASALAATGFTATAADNVYYRNIIRNNVSYNNVETFSCSAYDMGPGCHTDGEGIIIDCFDCSDFGKYNYKTLIVGNLVYGNGGNGIQVGRSSNVTVANNTSYRNYTDVNNSGTARSELGNWGGGNNIWVNNIAWAVPGAGVLSYNVSLMDEGAINVGGIVYNSSANAIWNNNIYYGAGLGIWGGAKISTTTNFNQNPGLVSAGTNFTLTSSSPALGNGLPEGFLSSATPNIGAY